MGKVLLHDVLQASYHDEKGKRELAKNGYKYDSMLSSKNQQVWVNPKSHKLLFTVAGTDIFSPRDLGTDLYLAFGGLKNTNRYKEAEDTLKLAKQKYHNYKTVVAGHSLGSTIGQQIASKGNGDKFYGLDGGYTIGQNVSDNKNFHHYRVDGDWVSGIGGLSSNMKTLRNKNWWKGPLIAHKLHNIKEERIFV
jgi:hypothetical protein